MFENRYDAGVLLSKKLHSTQNSLVIALARGGVAVGYPIAQQMQLPLEVLVVRKLGSPNNPELGIGAVAENGVVYLDNGLVDLLQISNEEITQLKKKEIIELDRRIKLYRDGKSLPLLTNKTVIVVDDGLATGVTSHAALLSLKKHHPKKIIFAVPVCSHDTAQAIRPLVDAIICLEASDHLESIGRFYEHFDQLTDEQVLQLLQKTMDSKQYTDSSEDAFTSQIIW